MTDPDDVQPLDDETADTEESGAGYGNHGEAGPDDPHGDER